MKKHLYFLIAAVLALLFSFNACSGDDDGVRATGVTLDKTSISIVVGSTERLTANIQPTDAANKTVSWQSSDDSVATVSDGSVRGVRAGSAKITVATEDGNFSASCAVTVTTPPATGVTLNKTSASILAGMSDRLTATVAPAAANQSVSWASSNEAIAAVAQDGSFIAVSAGTASIMATTLDGKHTSSPCVVTVTPNVIEVTAVTVVPSSLTLMEYGIFQLTAVATPLNAPASQRAVTWSSSNEDVATVNATGRVFANNLEGSAVITATSANGIVGTCALTVAKPIPVTGVTVDPTTATMQAGQSRQLVADIIPFSATNKNVTWSTSDPSVAAVSSNGLVCIVTGRRAGEATITVAANEGGHTATCAVTVTAAPATGVSLSRSSAEVLPGGVVQLTATVLPSYAEKKAVTWRSSNTAIAAVSATGPNTATVTGVSLGTADIIVATDDGGHTATCKVEVVSALTNVYIAGSSDRMVGFPFVVQRDGYPLWGKNDESWVIGTIGDTYGQAYSVYVTADDSVYKVGYYGARAALWKDGALDRYLSEYNSKAYSITVSGGDMYFAGYDDWDYPCVWKNNEAPRRLPCPNNNYYECSAMSVAVSGGDVYAAGQYKEGWYPRAIYWKGDAYTDLHPAGAYQSEARSVAVSSGGNVYVAGYIDYTGDSRHPAVWKDGVLQEYATIPGNTGGTAESVFIVGEKVYVAGYVNHLNTVTGYDYPTAALWEDGAPRLLNTPTPRLETRAISLYVYNGKAYMAGIRVGRDEYDNTTTWDMVVWKDSDPPSVIAPPPGRDTLNYARGIFVKQ
ncbi:MAG: Ig-like domain-containing protein [Holophagales bacterium]|jgi:uncharacterized protein YjdB|nr:Ig-like domain-containing protein [Holophagales bacterium]